MRSLPLAADDHRGDEEDVGAEAGGHDLLPAGSARCGAANVPLANRVSEHTAELCWNRS